ncbi:colipase-like [Clavelina lepadiformis]|uniref:Colipase N-terminal domain-containing protein n=1 Tax=Clavelina lepadiformis TaxID=159417 RepID=A0ABP0G737_CLALP
MRSVTLLFVVLLWTAADAQLVELTDLDNGELCFEGDQCKSYCCQRDSYTEIARCQAYNPEGARCQNDGIWDVYDYCPCELGLDCRKDSWDVYYCVDPNDS